MNASAIQRPGLDRRPHGVVDKISSARKSFNGKNGPQIGDSLEAANARLFDKPDQVQLTACNERSGDARAIYRSVQPRLYSFGAIGQAATQSRAAQ